MNVAKTLSLNLFFFLTQIAYTLGAVTNNSVNRLKEEQHQQAKVGGKSRAADCSPVLNVGQSRTT